MSLVTGDIVELVAPSSKISEMEYEKSVAYIRALGLVPRVPDYSELVDPSHCYAHTDEVRYHHLANAVNAFDSKAIWCLQGGHGASRLFENLALLKPTQRKCCIGFSDATAIELLFWQKWGWPSIYGPNLVQLAMNKLAPETLAETEAVLFATDTARRISGFNPLNKRATEVQKCRGSIVGGCLAILQNMLATPYMPTLEPGSILLLEDDRFESPERIDRMLGQWRYSGKCETVSAVILGNLLEQPEHQITQDEQQKLTAVLHDFGHYLDTLNIPLIQHKNIGHAYHMIPLVLGTESELMISDGSIELINTNFDRGVRA